MVVGEIGNGWRQVTSELGYERSGPERFMSPMPLLLAWLGSLGADPDAADAELLGRLTARLWSLRQLSVAVTAGLQRGDDVATSAALVKDLGTKLEQDIVDALRVAHRRRAGPGQRRPAGGAAGPGGRVVARVHAARRHQRDPARDRGAGAGGPVSETALLQQVTAEILRDYAAGREPTFGADAASDDGWAPDLWQTLDEAGLPLVGVPEAQGGAGGGWPEIAAVVRAAGRFRGAGPARRDGRAGGLAAG